MEENSDGEETSISKKHHDETGGHRGDWVRSSRGALWVECIEEEEIHQAAGRNSEATMYVQTVSGVGGLGTERGKRWGQGSPDGGMRVRAAAATASCLFALFLIALWISTSSSSEKIAGDSLLQAALDTKGTPGLETFESEGNRRDALARIQSNLGLFVSEKREDGRYQVVGGSQEASTASQKLNPSSIAGKKGEENEGKEALQQEGNVLGAVRASQWLAIGTAVPKGAGTSGGAGQRAHVGWGGTNEQGITVIHSSEFSSVCAFSFSLSIESVSYTPYTGTTSGADKEVHIVQGDCTNEQGIVGCKCSTALILTR